MQRSVWCSRCHQYHNYLQHVREFSGTWYCRECGYYHATRDRGVCPMTFDDWKIEEEDGVSADIEGRKRVLQKQIDRAADELALLEKFADVDFAIGTTLRWLHYNARDKGSDLVKERYRVVVKTGESSWLIVGALAASHIEQIIETFQKDGATVIEVSDGWTELGASK